MIIDNKDEDQGDLLSDKEIKEVQKNIKNEEFDDNDDVVVSSFQSLSAKPTKTGEKSSTKDEVSLS